MIDYLFACDLDNTLIHSYKHRIDDDVCIEIYNGREQSFISRKAVELLKEINKKVLFIPITTRSIEQYHRIQWIEGTKPKYAVISNGANLIYGDDINLQWKSNSFKNYIGPYSKELKRQQTLLSQNPNFNICRIIDDSFLFLKCSDFIDIEIVSTKLQEETSLTVQHSGRKIYLFPPELNKGYALLRLKKKFNPKQTFCAGDSVVDLPMLNIADFAYAPTYLIATLNHDRCLGFNLSDFILKDIYTKIK